MGDEIKEGIPEVSKEIPKEAPISEWGISRVEQRLAEIKELKNKLEKPLPEEEMEKLVNEIGQLNARKKEFSVGLREAANIARLVKDGTLRDADIERAFKRIEQAHPDDIELQEANFDLVRAEYAKLEEKMGVKEPKGEEVEKKEEKGITPEAAIKRLEEIGARRAEIEKKAREREKEEEKEGEGYYSKEDIEELQRLSEEQEVIIHAVLRRAPLTDLTAFPGMERMLPPIPPIEKIGPAEYEKEFDKRLHSLIEENVDQSFDIKWHLVYPLEIAIATLRPESELRKKLATKLAAFRACHNHGYLHARVEGTTPLISAANLLSVESIEYLLAQEPGIAETLRKLEDLGEEYRRTKDNRYKEMLFSQIKELVRKDWKGIVAGNLFKGLGEAARMDINLNNAGDFFLARIFNVTARARSDWETKWSRKPFPNNDLYKAVDLEVPSFWMRALGDYRERLIRIYQEKYKRKYGDEKREKEEGKKEGIESFNEFCKKKGIEEVEVDDKYEYGRIISASLVRAKFETMELGIGGVNPMMLSSNELTLTHLDIDDAENVRKLIINPGGLLQIPRLGILTRDINVVFKHLKGDQRYEWFRRVTKAVVDYYRDRKAPGIEENFPAALRESFSKSDFPDVVPWTWQYIRSQVEAMAPVLRRNEMNEVLKETIGTGWKAKVEGKRVASAVGAGILRGAGEFLGSLFKGIFGGK